MARAGRIGARRARTRRSDLPRAGHVMRFAVGVASVVFGGVGVEEAAARAAELGFDHLDCSDTAVQNLGPERVAQLPVPVGELLSGPDVRPGCTAMAPFERRGE